MMKSPVRYSIICATLSAACLFAAPEARSCTNILISKGASADGSVLVSYAADSHWLYGELYFKPSASWPEGSMVKVNEWDTGRYLGDIEQVPHTYKTVGNMNEHQVIIAETTFGGREELVDRKGRMDYGSMIYLALQRAKTAREAIDVMVSLANRYGYCSEGESFSIADKDEVWIMEVIGKGMNIRNGVNTQKGIVWVAMKVPDGAICAHANQARIGKFPLDDPENCLYAKDVISFARRKGYFEGEDDRDFSFRDAYCPVDFGAARGCDARAWSAYNILSDGWFTFIDDEGEPRTMDAYTWLDYVTGYKLDDPFPLFIYPRKKVTVKAVADVMRDHFEGTPMDMTQDIGAGGNALPYRWRPLTWEYEGDKYVNERAIATQQTGFWFVGQSRNYVPDQVGGILWFGTDDAATSYLTPIYTCINEVPECFREGNGDLLHYSETSSFWINNRIANACYKMYNIMAPTVRERADAFEREQMLRATVKVDSTAIMKYNECVYRIQRKMKGKKKTVLLEADPFKSVSAYLTEYCSNTAMEQFNAWKALEVELLIKYIDGNVKAQNEDGTFKHSDYSEGIPSGLTQPGYTETWKRHVSFGEFGDMVRVPKTPEDTEE